MSTNEKNKHYLMLCELHNPAFHGKDENSDPFIETHYLVYGRFDFKTGMSLTSESDDSYDDNESESESKLKKDKNIPKPVSNKGIPPSLLKGNLPRFAKAKRR